MSLKHQRLVRSNRPYDRSRLPGPIRVSRRLGSKPQRHLALKIKRRAPNGPSPWALDAVSRGGRAPTVPIGTDYRMARPTSFLRANASRGLARFEAPATDTTSPNRRRGPPRHCHYGTHRHARVSRAPKRVRRPPLPVPTPLGCLHLEYASRTQGILWLSMTATQTEPRRRRAAAALARTHRPSSTTWRQ